MGHYDDLTIKSSQPLVKVRGAITRHIERGYAIPNATIHTRADVTKTVELQRTMTSKWRKLGMRPQYQDLCVYALVRTVMEHPLANSHIIDEELRIYEEINVGLAVAFTGGLMIPVIKNTQDLDLEGLARQIRTTVRSVKDGKIPLSTLSGSTITVTSLTGYGIESFVPIINAPETNIFGIGSVSREPRFVDGELQNRWIGNFTLTFDHRAWDGAPASHFLRSLVARMENPAQMFPESE